MTIRSPDKHNLAELAALMPRYMSETYATEWHGSEQALRSAVAAGTLQMLVAAHRAQTIIGFVAWTSAYDLHWCVTGATILDLYVCPEARGRAVALRLLAAVAAKVQGDGGRFLRGTAVDTGSGTQLYGRAAVCNTTTECTVGGRAFRELAELENLPSRELLLRLPDAAWNYEA